MLFVLVASGICTALAWHPASALHRARHAIVLRPSSRALPPARMSSDDRPDEGDAQSDLFASLRSRLDKIGESCEERWREAECQSSIKLALEGWVRRIALDWPRAAIGTADGYVCLADLESGEVLTRKKAHPDYVDGEESARDMRLLHGEYDGGGLTSIALSGSFIASAGRDGGARLWHIGRAGEDGDELELQDRGELRDAGDAVVSRTLLSVDDELAPDGATGPGAVRCWTGGLDGVVRCWQAPMAAAASAPRCVLRVKAAGAVLDLALLEQRNLLACATTDGAVELFSTIDGTPCGRWRPFADGTDGELPLSTVAARSVAITHVDAAGEQRCALSSWATCPRPACMCPPRRSPPHRCVVVVGGTDGSVHACALIRNGSSESPSDGAVPSTQLDETLEPITLKPPHGGPVIALTPIGAVAAGRESGLLASGAHDGTLRIWDLAKAFKGESQACLFGLGGYKVRGSSLKVPLSASSIASLVACLTECLLDCFTNRMPH